MDEGIIAWAVVHVQGVIVDDGKALPPAATTPGGLLHRKQRRPSASEINENVNEFEKKWLTLLRDSKNMQTVPQEFADDPSVAAYFEASLYANLKEEEKLEYDKIMDTKYDIEDSLLDAELKGEKRGEKRGIAQGRAEGEAKMQLEIAKAMKTKCIDLATIAECTGLSEEQIRQI